MVNGSLTLILFSRHLSQAPGVFLRIIFETLDLCSWRRDSSATVPNGLSSGLVGILDVMPYYPAVLMFPSLHQKIVKAVSDDNISTWFNKNDSDEGSNNNYSTHVMGRFKCDNNACSTNGWSSKMVAMKIESCMNMPVIRVAWPIVQVANISLVTCRLSDFT